MLLDVILQENVAFIVGRGEQRDKVWITIL